MTGSGETPHVLFSPGQVNKVTGSTGCNRLNGSYDLTGVNFIKFSPLATTKRACPGMNKEAQFIEALGQANNWSIINDLLLLNNGKILLAKFRRIIKPVTMPDKPVAAAALNGTWNLNYISGIRIAFDGLYPDKKPTISFNLTSNELSGNTTCNGFTSKFTMNGNNIKFADPLKTMMFCEGGGEEAFLNMLKKVNNYALTDDNTLSFLIDDVAVMRFAKK
jgi:heat shock protein HslJ